MIHIACPPSDLIFSGRPPLGLPVFIYRLFYEKA